MKFKLIFILLLVSSTQLFSQNPTEKKPTSIGMVIYSNDTETVWNALRLANYSKNQGDTVRIFLLGKGVELDNLVKIDKDLKESAQKVAKSAGLSLSTLIGSYLRQVVATRRIELFAPEEMTPHLENLIAEIENELRLNQGSPLFDSVDAFLADLKS